MYCVAKSRQAVILCLFHIRAQVYGLYQGAWQTGEAPSKCVTDRHIADDRFGQTDSWMSPKDDKNWNINYYRPVAYHGTHPRQGHWSHPYLQYSVIQRKGLVGRHTNQNLKYPIFNILWYLKYNIFCCLPVAVSLTCCCAFAGFGKISFLCALPYCDDSKPKFFLSLKRQTFMSDL